MFILGGPRSHLASDSFLWGQLVYSLSRGTKQYFWACILTWLTLWILKSFTFLHSAPLSFNKTSLVAACHSSGELYITPGYTQSYVGLLCKSEAPPGQTCAEQSSTAVQSTSCREDTWTWEPLTWLLPQSHDGHDVMRHVKVWKHGQVCQPVGQLVQMQHLEQIHDIVSATLQRE